VSIVPSKVIIIRDKKTGFATTISDGNISIEFSYDNYGELNSKKSKSFELKLNRKNGLIVSKTETIIGKKSNPEFEVIAQNLKQVRYKGE